MKDDEPEPLSGTEHSNYRSHVARCLFSSQVRADIPFIINELCLKMSDPTHRSLAKLKRLVRYLKRERQRGQVFSCGRMVEEVTTFSDSDWAGCKETRKSPSAGMILLLSRSHVEKSIHTQATYHCKEQRRSRIVCSMRWERLSRT